MDFPFLDGFDGVNGFKHRDGAGAFGGVKARMVAVLAAVALCAVAKTPSRVDVTTQPDSARVSVDGEVRGTSPLQLFDLAPGNRLFHVEAPGFIAVDEYVTVGADGAFVQKHFELEQERALILVRTDPQGAEVRCQGLSLGTTPLFISSLATDADYVFELSRPGYRSAKVAVRPSGRTPAVVAERLAIDSGTLECITEPAGAEVVVNGIARGTTPVTVENVSKGNATVSFRMNGYRSETRQVVVAPDGSRQTVLVKLVGLPATLKVVSSPEGARVFVDDNYQGKTPTSAPQLIAGEHKIRVELDGHATQERTVMLTNGGETTETFQMESVLGRLEIVTVPAGAKVQVDGKAVGTTKAIQGATRSAVLAVEKVSAGERSVQVSALGCQDVVRKVKVPPKGTSSVTIVLKHLFVPDTEIETIQGTTRRGVLIGDGRDVDGVHLEVSPGVEQVFPHETIRKMRQLTHR